MAPGEFAPRRACRARHHAHASSKAAEDLKVSVGEPLFLETIHFLDQDGRPLMIGRQYIVGSLYIFNI